jgi:hypothetical protein
MPRLPPTPSTIKKLFAYTGNQCAMPNCKELIVDPSGTMLGKSLIFTPPKKAAPDISTQ